MNNELPKTKVDERTGIEYHLEGDYYISNIIVSEQEKIVLKLYWVGTMNSIKAQAEEIVFSELIYI